MNVVEEGEGLQCFICHQWYDLLCANISDKRLKSMSAVCKSTWKCLGCLNKLPKVDNTNTPARPTRLESPIKDDSPPVHTNVTQRTKKSQRRLSEHESDMLLTEITSGSLREIIRQEIGHALRDTVTEVVKEEFNRVYELVDEVKRSISFYNHKYEEMKTTLEEKSAKIQKLEKDNTMLQNSLNEISKRMNSLEQHARSSNIEVQCVPEHRSENLITTVLQLSKVINCDIKETDIQLCIRTAKKDTQNTRPRSILVKFNTPRLRDTFFAAAITFNKNNANNKLNSSHLGIAADPPTPIFVAEHLSAENKALHAATRIRSKELKYKFVWVRNGKIFMKKDESSQSIIINSLEKLKSVT